MLNSRVLITGFEPFANVTRNPAGSVVELLTTDDIVTHVLPVEYSAAAVQLEQLIAQHHPIAWIGFGLSHRATAITLEQVAANLDDASIPDNAGELRRGLPIDPCGREVYRSTLPLDAIAAELRLRNIPVDFSDNAGRFVCNHIFYHALSILSQKRAKIPTGFIHLPWPSDWDPPLPAVHSVTLTTMVQAVRICISTTLHEIRRENILAT